MNCPICNTPNETAARYCVNCGAELPEDQTAPSPGASPPASSRPQPLIIGGAVLLLLIIGAVAYWLLGRQPATAEAVTIDQSGGTLTLADGALVTIPAESLAGPLQLDATVVESGQLSDDETNNDPALSAALTRLPEQRAPHDSLYRFEIVEGQPPDQAIFSVPVGPDEAATLDLYGWDGERWRWLPFRLDPDAGQLTAQLDSLPEAVALLRLEPAIPIVSVTMAGDDPLPPEADGAVSELLLPGFTLQPDGSIAANPPLPETDSAAVLIPSLRNWRDDGSLTADMGNILGNPTSRQRHQEAVVGLALAGGYPAVQIDYRGMGPIHRQFFSDFITGLAAALHEQERQLLVRVDAPVQISESRWETEAFDLAVLGQAADRVQVPLPLLPDSPDKGLLDWLTGQIERTKLQPLLSAAAAAASEDAQVLPVTQLPAHLGDLLVDGDEPIAPDGQMTLALSGLNDSTLEYDHETGLLHLPTASSGNFYFYTATSLNQWTGQMAAHQVAGVAIDGMLAGLPGSQGWDTLRGYRAGDLPLLDSDPHWLWSTAAAGTPDTVSETKLLPLNQIEYGWIAPEESGSYQVAVALAMGDDQPNLPVAAMVLAVEREATPTPTPRPTRRVTPTRTPTLTPTATSRPRPPVRTYQVAFGRWDGSFYDLYIADTNGNNERLILRHAAGPSWSPDKQRLFFLGQQGVDRQMREEQVACTFGTISEGIVAIDLPSPATDLCQVQGGEWFCERRTVDLQSEPSDVCTANNGISVYQNLDWKVGSARWASTAPNGDAVAFDAKPGGDYRIYFRAMLGTSQQFRFEIPGEHASWSPDGQRVVYRSGRNNQVGLWISNRDDSNPTRITNQGTDAFPAWSPDGRTIAFSREIEGDVEIFTVNTDGSNLQRLTNARGPDTLPAYAPDGQIVFRSGRGDSWGIWKMGGNGSGQTQIVANAGLGPDWAYGRVDVK